MTAERSKTVLVIAGEFPPIKTIGRIRSAKLVEHLPAHGWHPIVLTVDRPGLYDAGLEGEIPPGAQVYRAPYPDLEETIIARLKALLGRAPSPAGPDGRPDQPIAQPREEHGGRDPAPSGGLVDKGSRLVG